MPRERYTAFNRGQRTVFRSLPSITHLFARTSRDLQNSTLSTRASTSIQNLPVPILDRHHSALHSTSQLRKARPHPKAESHLQNPNPNRSLHPKLPSPAHTTTTIQNAKLRHPLHPLLLHPKHGPPRPKHLPPLQVHPVPTTTIHSFRLHLHHHQIPRTQIRQRQPPRLRLPVQTRLPLPPRPRDLRAPARCARQHDGEHGLLRWRGAGGRGGRRGGAVVESHAGGLFGQSGGLSGTVLGGGGGEEGVLADGVL